MQVFDSLLASLDVRGTRESHLHMMLKRIEMSFKKSLRRNIENCNMRMQNGDTVKKLETEAVEMATNKDFSANICCPTSVCIDDLDASETSTSFMVHLGRNEVDNKDAAMRYCDFERWMRKECLNSSVLRGMQSGRKRCNQLLAMCYLCHHVYFFGGTTCPSCYKSFTSSTNESKSSSECLARSEGKINMGTHYYHVSPLRTRLLKILLSDVEVTQSI